MKAIINGTLIQTDGLIKADVLLKHGRIADIDDRMQLSGKTQVINADGCIVISNVLEEERNNKVWKKKNKEIIVLGGEATMDVWEVNDPKILEEKENYTLENLVETIKSQGECRYRLVKGNIVMDKL